MPPFAERVNKKCASIALFSIDNLPNVWLNRPLPRPAAIANRTHGPTSLAMHSRGNAAAGHARRQPCATTGARSDHRWKEILDCAARLFYTRGYHGTTVEDVASAAGLLKGSLYYYISSKEDLLYELLMEIIVIGHDTLRNATADSSDPVEWLRNALRAHVSHITANQVRVGLFLHEVDSLSGERRKRVQRMVRDYQKLFVNAVRDGQVRGYFVAADATLIVNALLGMCNWMYRWYGRPGCPPAAHVQETFANIAMKGISRA